MNVRLHHSVRKRHAEEIRQLATALCAWNEKRAVAKALHVGLSTIYRWLRCAALAPSRDSQGGREPADLDRLIALCGRRGIPLRDNIRTLALGRSRSPTCRATQYPVQPKADSIPIEADLMLRDVVKYVSQEVRYRLQLVRDVIDERYFTRLGCEEFSRVAKMSKYNLINRFTAVYGVSPYRYLLQVRIAHAKRMLRSTDAPVGAVAIAIGFDSPSSLSKAFRNIEGVALSSFRRDPYATMQTPRTIRVDHANSIQAKREPV